MECLICGKDLTAMTSHLTKHGVSAREYKVMFNIPLGTPLQEKWLNTHLSAQHKKLCSSEEGKEKITLMKAKAVHAVTGSKWSGRELPECTKTLRKKEAIELADKKALAAKESVLNNLALLTDFNNGASYTELASKYNIQRNCIRKWLGKSKARPSGTNRRYTDKQKESIIEEYKKGCTCLEVAKKLSIGLGTVEKLIANYKRGL